MNENTRGFLSSFLFGDMLINYLIDADDMVTLEMLPLGMEDEVKRGNKIYRPDSLIQAKLLGDNYPGTLAGGQTMMNSGTVLKMKYDHQDVNKDDNSTVIRTCLTDGSEHLFVHVLQYTEGDYAVKIHTEFINNNEKDATLEYLTSFSLGNVTPFVEGSADDALAIYRIKSKWSHEGRLVKEKAATLQLEDSWVDWHPLCVRFGQRGSMPVREYSPFVAVEDEESKVTWGAMLAIETSWQMEIYRRDHALVLAGGLADKEFGHWTKVVKKGEVFETPWSIVSVAKGDVDYLSQRMTHYNNKFLANQPECEQSLPVLFNEYCTTWGLPSHENVMNTVNAIKDHDIKYFVIDCGWYVEEGKHWGDGMGDYIPSDKLFPNGIKYTVDSIKEAGLKPGIWFEIDNAGKDSHIYENEDMFLKRDGYVLTSESRRFFDMANPKVADYLRSKVVDQIKEYGFEYIKMDYNDTIGLGCDGYESIGEGLRVDREASVAFVRNMRAELPELIVENCASGGHKTEPLMMSICAMASFSDAHECEHMPLIAAGLHRTILPRQSQIWAVIRKDDSLRRIAYTLSNTFLGRMCLSGDVTELTKEQWDKIDEGIAFYHRIAPIIKNGYSYIYKNTGESDRKLTGYQAVVRVANAEDELIPKKATEAYAVVHIFKDAPKEIRVELPENCPKNIASSFSGTNIEVSVNENCLIIRSEGEFEAVSVHLN